MRTALLLLMICITLNSCVNDPEPQITPDQPQFTNTTSLADPVDHRIYADVDPNKDAIIVEWIADTTGNTSGYHIYRSEDSLVDNDGLMTHRISVGEIESTNLLSDPLPTSFRDTTNIHVGLTYYYQLQAFHRSPTNRMSNSAPTHVGITTSFHYETRVNLLNPDGDVAPPPSGLVFRWQDPENGGLFQIIVERRDVAQYVWSGQRQDFQSILSTEYPSTATPLVVGGQYRWRVKRVDLYGGSSSSWKTFNVVQ